MGPSSWGLNSSVVQHLGSEIKLLRLASWVHDTGVSPRTALFTFLCLSVPLHGVDAWTALFNLLVTQFFLSVKWANSHHCRAGDADDVNGAWSRGDALHMVVFFTTFLLFCGPENRKVHHRHPYAHSHSPCH